MTNGPSVQRDEGETGGRSVDAIDRLKDAPEEHCIRVATRWGTVFIRYRTDLHHWSKSVWLPDESTEDGQWYESRVYAEERQELLEHEHSVYPITRHPNVEERSVDTETAQDGDVDE